jgi:hypothetical protein
VSCGSPGAREPGKPYVRAYRATFARDEILDGGVVVRSKLFAASEPGNVAVPRQGSQPPCWQSETALARRRDLR